MLVMIVLRVIGGIKEHFQIRISEWIMMLPSFGMAAAFAIMPDMFTVSPSFASLSRWGNEGTWGLVVFACGVMRLAALTINGTFRGFGYSPHIRFFASLVGLIFWSQFTLGFIIAFTTSNGALSAVVSYFTFCVLELANLYRSGSDIGKSLKGA